jgi:hypothetical protein
MTNRIEHKEILEETMRLLKILLFGLLLVSYPALAADNVEIHFNYPQDTIFIGATNTMQIWVASDDSIKGISLGFEMSGYSGMVVWDLSFGDRPPVNRVDEWMRGFTFGGVVSYGMSDSYLPDSVLMGDAYMPPSYNGVAPDGIRRAYWLQFDIPAGESTGTFCVDNAFIPPAGTWLFDNGSAVVTPNYHGCVNSGPNNPDCPAVCFPVAAKNFVCGDVNDDTVVNISDMVYILNFIFNDGTYPVSFMAADVNCNGRVSIGDVTYIMAYVFMGGNMPCSECP